MIRTIGFPGRYIQGPDAIKTLPSLLIELGCKTPVIVGDDIVMTVVGKSLGEYFQQAGLKASFMRFPGECSANVIAALSAEASALGVDTVIALGGGKTIDTAKGIAKFLGSALIVVPTIASNDSPTSRLIVLYDDKHRVAGVEIMARNPDAVLVDTNIVARAPARFFAAGLGDALSKKFESEQCQLSGGHNFFGTTSLPIARLMARHCYETIIEYGQNALSRVANTQTPDDSVERVVEASVLLSGVGFESGGLSLAHALTRGFTAQPTMASMLHGELVAFGAIVQLVAQEQAEYEIESHARFVATLGLPICFADLGEPKMSSADIEEVARLTCTAPYIGNLQPKADASRVAWALTKADAIGRTIRRAM